MSRKVAIAFLLTACAPAISAPSRTVDVQPRSPAPALSAARPPAPPPKASSVLDRAIVEALRPEARAPKDAELGTPDAPLPTLVRDRSGEASEPAQAEGADPDARLPPESIQRVVRASSGRFRNCYQRALVRDREASGHISTWFVIGGDGRVDLVQEESSSLPDRDARACVMKAFFELHFPAPPGRLPITVLYPMRFGDEPTGPQALPSARKVAEPPPPGFAERMRNGVRVQPDPVILPFEDAAPPEPRAPSRCAAGDPICPEL